MPVASQRGVACWPLVPQDEYFQWQADRSVEDFPGEDALPNGKQTAQLATAPA
jgi:hypothetical protein